MSAFEERAVSFLSRHSTLTISTFLIFLILLILVAILAVGLARLRRTQTALLESEAMFRTLFEHSAVGSAQADPISGRFLRVNSRLCQILGRSKDELLRMGFADVTHPDDLAYDVEQVRRMIAGEIQEYTRQKRYIRKDGSVVWAALSAATFSAHGGSPDWFITVVQDITTLKEAEDQLIKSERLSAVSHLSAGIAHEFNNMLMIILGYTDLLRVQHGEIKEVGNACNIIESQVARGHDIVSQMRVLANPSPLRIESLKVGELVEEILRAQTGQLESEQIKVVRAYGTDASIQGDHRQLHQVLASLIVNARHAIRVKGHGKITIKTALNQSNLELSVIDTGIGMSEEVKKKIFVPFFTTKGGFSTNNLGIKGSGLSLCVCLRIVQMHSGRITFESVEGEGTRFTVTLPTETISAVGQPALNVTRPPRVPRLLVVDDETAICDVLQQMLLKRGFRQVDTASSGMEALERMETQTYDIAFVDLIMSGMSGLDLLKEVQSKRIETRFIFISGQFDVTEDELVKKGSSGFLHKPFSFKQLDQILQRVLDTTGSSAPPPVS